MKPLLRALCMVAAACGWITAAHAYDSKCRLGNGKECREGMETARKRWTAADSEHRLLWEDSVRRLGLPSHLTGLVELKVPTDDSLVVIGSGSSTGVTVRPFPFAAANTLTTRAYSIGEMAQLPDFSYGLWDWVFGNEACPLPIALKPDVCHSFKQHMGAVNSSHFLPQSKNFYHHYHTLALTVAGECNTLRASLEGAYPEYVQACEQEAFTLEAIAHHFLQDAWSTGHMWQRWGGPELTDFGVDPRPRALMIGAASGLIHGARGLLQEYGEFVNADVLDPLCAPLDPKAIDECTLCISGDQWDKLSPPSYFDPATGSVERGVGDLYYERLTQEYGVQFGRLLDCAGASIVEVAKSAGLAVTPPTSLGPEASTSQFDTVCFGQRATNGSMYIGAGIDIHDDKLVDEHIHIGFSPLIASRTVTITLPPTPQQLKDWFGVELPSSITVGNREVSAAEIVIQLVQLNIGVTVPNAMEIQFRRDMANIANVLATRAIAAPDATDVADSLPALVGMRVNGDSAYTHSPPANYVDPKVPATLSNSEAPNPDTDAGRGLGLARAYHRAHARQWCETLGFLDLDALKATKPGPECDICVEFVQRHLRFGNTSADYDTTREPVCGFLAPNSQFIYHPDDGDATKTLAQGAREWCGCAETACQGALSGLIIDSETREPVLTAVASLTSTFATASAEPLEDGSFSVEPIQCGNYSIDISAPGYLPATLTATVSEAESSAQLVELKAISESCSDEPSEVVGWVADGATGDFINGALVELHAGADSPSGPLFGTARTDNDGVFSFSDVPRGYYTVVVDARGYESGVTQQVSACGGMQRYVDDIYLMPTSERALSFVLNWARPDDLDLHLLLPSGDEVSFGDCAGSLTSEPYATLDVDHQKADGPEVITLSKFLPGTYRLIVHNYSAQNEGGSSFVGSQADLVVYNHSAFYDRYYAPTSGSGYFWDVLEFQEVDGQVQIEAINQLTNAHSNPVAEEYLDTCTPAQ